MIRRRGADGYTAAMPPHHIDSLDDPRLDPYRHLRRSNKTRWSGQFIAEGRRVVQRLIDSGLTVDSVLVSEECLDALIAAVPQTVPLWIVSHALASELVGYNFHYGVAACGIRPQPPRLCDVVARMPQPPLAVACPHITDPDNLGGLTRLCAGFGAGALLLGGDCCDPYSRRVLRVSMGAAFTVPIIESVDLEQELRDLQAQHGFRLLATVLDPDATPLADLVCGRPSVLLLGNESAGLASEWVALCDERVTIPMVAADSLNVTVAAGVFLHWLRFGGIRSV